VSQLVKGERVEWRNSLLTKLLKDAFISPGARMVFIANVSTHSQNCSETLNTLAYANQLKDLNQRPLTTKLVSIKPSATPVSEELIALRIELREAKRQAALEVQQLKAKHEQELAERLRRKSEEFRNKISKFTSEITLARQQVN